ncbi:hypothetical protein [Crocosphaera sp.]|uniref:hypothetical protein n=1 Tax=Crocosphaera sp. TaxID=2729996 RepID=UPI002606026C|nr:hypothetical protein [Crocosphaera sp.]MDJ0581268.1 hypothetical protein [Crocosphaera sp.]
MAVNKWSGAGFPKIAYAGSPGVARNSKKTRVIILSTLDRAIGQAIHCQSPFRHRHQILG